MGSQHPPEKGLEPNEARQEPIFSRKRFKELKQAATTTRTQSRLSFFTLGKTLRNYNLKSFGADTRAGLNVALLDFPQGMAYAMIAGLPFYYGIYASAVAAMLGPFMASSRFIMLGPTNAIAVLCLSVFLNLGFTQQEAMVAMPLLLLMVAGMMVIGAYLKVASVIRYVSRTVITGYITAAAFLIIIKQLKNVLGIETQKAATFIETAVTTFQHLPEFYWPSLLTAALTALLYLGLKRFFKGLPHVAVTLLAMYGFARYLESLGYPVPLLSDTPLVGGQWPVTFPVLDLEMVGRLAEAAFALTFLSLLESSSIARALAARAGDSVNLNQQMLSMGVANAGCAFLGGMPISGSLTRSVLNWSSGARSALSSMISAAILGLGIWFLAPHLSSIPMPALSMLVILVGVSLLNGKQIRIALSSTHSDAGVFIVTFVSGLLFPLDTAIYLGVGSSIFLFMRKAGSPDMIEFSFTKAGEEQKSSQSQRPGLALLHVEGDLFFGSSDIFLEQARQMANDERLKVIILRLRNAHHLDATCAQAIEQLVTIAREKDRHVLISGAHPEVVRVFRNSGLTAYLGPENIFREDPDNPNLSTTYALKRARQLAGEELEIRLFVSDKDEDK